MATPIPRKRQLIFGANFIGAPTDALPLFGSLAASAPSYSSDVFALQTAAWLDAWEDAVIGTQSPTKEDFQTMGYVLSAQIAYLMQAGMAQWDVGTTYFALQSWVAGSDGMFYRSLQDNNVGNDPTTPGSAWWISLPKAFATTSQQSRAWVTFSAQSGSPTIVDSYNVSTVALLSTGNYLITFTNALPNATYCVTMSAAQNGLGGSGDVIATRLIGDIKSATQLQVRSVNCVGNTGAPCPEFAVQIFANG